jgi:hypothetical protein
MFSRLRSTLMTLVFVVVSVRGTLYGQVVVPLQVTGDSAKRVDIAVLGDGYTADELGKFATDVNQFLAGFFAQSPFDEYKNFLNVWRIDVASNESGADHPEQTPPVFKDTAFDATYNCAGIQRLICVSTSKVSTAVGVLAPSQRDLILVIVNDPEYGGSGGSVAVASTNSAAVELILHETGHTFAFLADEYTSQPPPCSDSIEPSEPDATKETNRSFIKWTVWIDAATPVPTGGTQLSVPGLYQGAKYCPTTLYRPTYDSKMRSLGRPYDQINTEQFIKRFYEYAQPIESQSPASSLISLVQGQTQQFAIATPQPATHTLDITWVLDGLPFAAGSLATVSSGGLLTGNHTLTATVDDPTPAVRNDPQSRLTQQTTWTIMVSGRKVRAQLTSQ